EAVAKHLEESLAHGAGADGVQREAGPLPIAATTELAQLAQDAGLVLVLPLPDAPHECVTPQVVAGFLFLLVDEPLDHGLGRDARMIGPRHVQGVETLHAP